MNKFTELFKLYGWTVEQLGCNSFIAYNDVFFVPFSCVPSGRIENQCISAVSYLLYNKDPFIEAWRNYNRHISLHGVDIGTYAFNDFFGGDSKFHQYGALGSRNHSIYEIEHWLKRIDVSVKIRKRSGKSDNGNIKNIHPTDVISDPEGFKLKVMANPKLNDIQKLKYIFDISKEELKKRDPQLYYAILGVVHSAKCMKCAGLFPPSDYFTHANESKEE